MRDLTMGVSKTQIPIMGFRFQKRIRLAPGIRLNLSKGLFLARVPLECSPWRSWSAFGEASALFVLLSR
jgi:hypothetical protein